MKKGRKMKTSQIVLFALFFQLILFVKSEAQTQAYGAAPSFKQVIEQALEKDWWIRIVIEISNSSTVWFTKTSFTGPDRNRDAYSKEKKTEFQLGAETFSLTFLDLDTKKTWIFPWLSIRRADIDYEVGGPELVLHIQGP